MGSHNIAPVLYSVSRGAGMQLSSCSKFPDLIAGAAAEEEAWFLKEPMTMSPATVDYREARPQKCSFSQSTHAILLPTA
jgi:hypothetical protein